MAPARIVGVPCTQLACLVPGAMLGFESFWFKLVNGTETWTSAMHRAPPGVHRVLDLGGLGDDSSGAPRVSFAPLESVPETLVVLGLSEVGRALGCCSTCSGKCWAKCWVYLIVFSG